MYPRVAILMPVRDDWTSAAELIRRLDGALASLPYKLEVLLVDDGSAQPWDAAAFQFPFTMVNAIRILRLRRNLGHQRAIAIGLTYVEQSLRCEAVMVMDADGEDTPEGARKLLEAFFATGGEKAIFAERTRRSESLAFRASYAVYKALHLVLTGLKVRVGNFSVVPFRYLSTLVVLSELWNHYAAAVFHSKLPFGLVPIPRGHRIAGTSKMNWVALIMHGLSAISVFGDVVGVRILMASLAACLLVTFGIAVVIVTRLFSTLAIPGWATYAAGILILMLVQLVSIASSFTFFILSNRANLGFVPLRDYRLFIAECVDVYRHE